MVGGQIREPVWDREELISWLGGGLICQDLGVSPESGVA